MIPNASEITRRRLTAGTVIRLASIAVWVAGLLPLGVTTFVVITFPKPNGSVPEEAVAWGLITLFAAGGGFTLWRGASRLTRVMIPMRRKIHCPACDYVIEGLTEPLCPECGLALTTEFLAVPPPKHPEPARTAFLVKLRDVFTPIVRVLGALLAIAASVPAIVSTAGFIAVVRHDNEPEAELTLAAVMTICYTACAFGVFAVFKGFWLARRMIPRSEIETDAPRNTDRTPADDP